MAKAVNIEMDARNLNGALRELSRLSGKDFRTVVQHETTKIMEGALKRTPAAKVGDIRKNSDDYEFITASAHTYATKGERSAGRYQGFARKKGNHASPRVVYYRFNRYPDELWAKLMDLKKKRVQRRIMARGLLKKSWIQVAEKIGIALEGVAGYVAGANSGGRDYPEDTKGGQRRSISNFEIWGVIERVYDWRIIKALSASMRARINYFRTNLKKGVFLKGKEIARRYPGLYVNGN